MNLKIQLDIILLFILYKQHDSLHDVDVSAGKGPFDQVLHDIQSKGPTKARQGDYTSHLGTATQAVQFPGLESE